MQRSKPLPRKPMRRHTGLKRASGFRHKLNPVTRGLVRRKALVSRVLPAVPPALRKALLARSDGLCEAALPGCLGTATDPCHRVGQAQGGADTLCNTFWACRRCHEWCHSRPAEAYDLGLMLKSWQLPELEPMAYRNSRWVLLGADGDVAEFGDAA